MQVKHLTEFQMFKILELGALPRHLLQGERLVCIYKNKVEQFGIGTPG